MTPLIIGIAAWISMWTSLSVTPSIVRANVQGGDLANIFVGPLILWGIVIALHLVALVSGVLVIRRARGNVAGLIGATIGATGFVGLVLYFVATYIVIPVFA